MAQTIALQRGYTSTAASGGNVTLFTQSGGIATRVIVNNLSVCVSPSAYYTNYVPGILVNVAQSGGGSYVIGHAKVQTWSGYSAMQFLPYGPDNVFITQHTGYFPMILIGYSSTSGVGNASLSGGFSSNVQISSGNSYIYSGIASNFYIGPNDSVQIRVYAQYGDAYSGIYPCTAYIYYSFTTITES
ncbi:hypothetical protein EB118_07370 [bacterium]|nr:hypothetical protein [bacterium]